MKRSSGFITDKYILLMIVLGISVNVGLWYYLKYSLYSDNTFVTLHYTVASGVDLIGTTSDLFNLPYYAALLTFLNIILARLVYFYDTFFSYILVSAPIFLNATVFFNGFLLVSINA